MARNLEIKVRCTSEELADVEFRARELEAGAIRELRQTDTYFSVFTGRLKMREIEEAGEPPHAELIGYQRASVEDSRWSDYTLVELSGEQAGRLRAALAGTLGVESVVEKVRRVSITGRTRIHLDRVAGLGTFVELETVAGEGDSDDEIAREHQRVIDALGLGRFKRLAGSYGELIKGKDESA